MPHVVLLARGLGNIIVCCSSIQMAGKHCLCCSSIHMARKHCRMLFFQLEGWKTLPHVVLPSRWLENIPACCFFHPDGWTTLTHVVLSSRRLGNIAMCCSSIQITETNCCTCFSIQIVGKHCHNFFLHPYHKETFQHVVLSSRWLGNIVACFSSIHIAGKHCGK